MSFIDVPVAHGRLEAIFWKAETPQGAVVVCHPHPAQGGTMHNHVTYRIAKAFRDRSISTLRFNFRGVGRSTGTYDEGRGEGDQSGAGGRNGDRLVRLRVHRLARSAQSVHPIRAR